MDFVLVQGGAFQMGSPDSDSDAYDDEKPQHQVMVRDFYMSQLVTQKMWLHVMGDNPSCFEGRGEYPVESVSWNDTQKFLAKINAKNPGMNYRLPTEAEWEYAARGGQLSSGYKYAGSNNIGEVGWYIDNSDIKTHPICGKQPNELGLYDMTGNVWEWCDDWYELDYYKNSPSNPCPPTSFYRVVRGGCWNNDPENCRLAKRYRFNPAFGNGTIGFRIVFDA